jgi:hypothetical protein
MAHGRSSGLVGLWLAFSCRMRRLLRAHGLPATLAAVDRKVQHDSLAQGFHFGQFLAPIPVPTTDKTLHLEYTFVPGEDSNNHHTLRFSIISN